jgi:hypothetical protein
MANKDIKLKIDAAVESAEAAKSLGQLRRALLEIQELQSQVGETSGENFDKLAQASTNASAQLAQTRDAIGDIQDKTRTLEGTPVERLSGSFGLLKESILNLDFDKAKIAFDGFNNLASSALDNIKGGAKGLFGSFKEGFASLASNPLGAISNGFTSLTSGVKNLGSTFVSVGKALLTNPIFLLATAITLIVIAVIKLLDSLGLLKPIMDGIKAAIGAVIDAFKALTDFLGLTDNAGEKLSQKQKKRTEDDIKDAEKLSKSKQDLYNLTKDLTDDEIKLLEKRLSRQIDTSQSIFDIQKEEAQSKKDAYAAEIEQLEGRKMLSDEDKKRLQEVRAKYDEENAKIVASEQQKQAAILKGARNADNILQSLRAKSIENENQRSKAFLDIAQKEAIAKLEQAKREAKQLGDNETVKKLEEAITLTKKDFSNQRKKIDDDANKAAADAQKKAGEDALNNAKSNTNKQLKELEKAEKIKVNATKEGTQERLDAELNFINEIEKYQKKNASMLGLNQKDLTLIYQENEKKREKLREEFEKAETDKNNRIKLAAAEVAILEAKTDEERLAAKKKQIEAERDIELNNVELTADERKKIELEAKNDLAAIDTELKELKEENNQKVLDSDRLTSETKLSQAEFDAEKTKGTLQQEVVELENINKLKLDTLKKQRLAELGNTELTEAEKAEIEERYRQAKETATAETEAKITEITKTENQKRVDAFNSLAATIKSVMMDGASAINTALSGVLTGVSNVFDILNTEYKEGLEGTMQKINDYAQAIGGVLTGFVSAIADANKQRLEDNLTSIKEETNGEKEELTKRYKSGLLDKSSYDKAWKDLDDKAKTAELNAKKKAFEQEKKTKIAMSVIQGLQGAVAAFTGAMSLGVPTGPIVGGILAAAVAAMTAINVNKIKSSKFDAGDATQASAPDVSGAGGGGEGSNMASFSPTQFFGLGQGGPQSGGGANGATRVYVTETDITSTQNRVRVIEDRAVIG